MRRFKTRWIVAVAGAALVAMAGVAAVAGQEQVTPGSGTTQTFLERVAGKLGIGSDTLRRAVQDSASDEIDERVASGDLTQEQADAMTERLADAGDDVLLGFGGHAGLGRHGGPGFGIGSPDELADFFGVGVDDLRIELQADGATLATVAATHGKSRDELKAFMTEQVSSHLAEHVANGDLTQEEADGRLAEKTADLDEIIDREGHFPVHHGHGPFDGFGGVEPDDTATPDSNG